MSEATTTRKTLRRALALAERMDFYRRYAAAEVALTGTPTATTMPCTSLTQADDHWNSAWVFMVDGTYAEQERRITDFTASTDLITIEYALAGAPAAGNKIEICSGWSPTALHEAINRSIERAARIFPATYVDTTLCLVEDKLRYSLTSLANPVRSLQRVWIERVPSSQLGVIDSISTVGDNLQIVDASLFTVNDAYNTWKIAIYAGTGAGQIGTIDDVVASGTYAVVTAADFTVAPAADSKFRIWNENVQRLDLYEVHYRRLDVPVYPDTLYLENLEPEFYGCRLHVQYSGLPGALTTETSTTIIPKELILLRARAILHEEMMSDNRADAQRHSQLASYFHQQADDFTFRFAPQRPAEGLSFEHNSSTSREVNDPLDWGN